MSERANRRYWTTPSTGGYSARGTGERPCPPETPPATSRDRMHTLLPLDRTDGLGAS